jgi:hypothetical protein
MDDYSFLRVIADLADDDTFREILVREWSVMLSVVGDLMDYCLGRNYSTKARIIFEMMYRFLAEADLHSSYYRKCLARWCRIFVKWELVDWIKELLNLVSDPAYGIGIVRYLLSVCKDPKIAKVLQEYLDKYIAFLGRDGFFGFIP